MEPLSSHSLLLIVSLLMACAPRLIHPTESYTAYKSWGKGEKQTLRFSKSGQQHIETAYTTHFLKPNP